MIIQNSTRIGLYLEYGNKNKAEYCNFQCYQNWVSLAARYRRWSNVCIGLRVQEKQSYLCIGKDRIQCRPVQEMPAHLHANSSSSIWASWEQLCISPYFQNSVQALSWPTVQFGSLFLIFFISFMPLESLKSSHFTSSVDDMWRPHQLCSICLQCVFILGFSWLYETLCLPFSFLRLKQSCWTLLLLLLIAMGVRAILFLCSYLSILFSFGEAKLVFLGQKLSQGSAFFLFKKSLLFSAIILFVAGIFLTGAKKRCSLQLFCVIVADIVIPLEVQSRRLLSAAENQRQRSLFLRN